MIDTKLNCMYCLQEKDNTNTCINPKCPMSLEYPKSVAIPERFDQGDIEWLHRNVIQPALAPRVTEYRSLISTLANTINEQSAFIKRILDIQSKILDEIKELKNER